MKLVKESLNGYHSYEYYDMSNGLSIPDTIIPELEKLGVSFNYDSYSNFLTIDADSDNLELVKDIIENIREGDSTGNEMEDDAILINHI